MVADVAAALRDGHAGRPHRGRHAARPRRLARAGRGAARAPASRTSWSARPPSAAPRSGSRSSALTASRWDADAVAPRPVLVPALALVGPSAAPGRLRGGPPARRAINEAAAVEASVTRAARRRRLQAVELLRAPGDVRVALAETVRRMVVAAHGLEARGIAPADRLDLAAARAVLRVLDDVADAARRRRSPDELRGLLRAPASTCARTPPRASWSVDLRAARTLDADVVIVLGLEQGGFALAAATTRSSPDDLRDALGEGLQAAEPGDLERHLLYVALARGAATGGRLPPRRVRRRPPARALAAVADVARAAGGARRYAAAAWPTSPGRSRPRRPRASGPGPCRAWPPTIPRGPTRIADADGDAAGCAARATGLPAPDAAPRPAGAGRRCAALDRFPVTSLERFGDCSAVVVRRAAPEPARHRRRLRRAPGRHDRPHRAAALLQGPAGRFGKDRLEPGDADPAGSGIRELVDEAMRGQTLPSDTLEARIVARRVARDLARFVAAGRGAPRRSRRPASRSVRRRHLARRA